MFDNLIYLQVSNPSRPTSKTSIGGGGGGGGGGGIRMVSNRTLFRQNYIMGRLTFVMILCSSLTYVK